MEIKKFEYDREGTNLTRLLPFFLASLLIAVLLFSLSAVGGAKALANTLYVDDATGADSGNCQTDSAPCRTINYAIGQAGIGDSILIAGGTYTENVIVNQEVSLIGGYEATGWTRNLSIYTTIINADDSGRPVSVHEMDNVTLDGLELIGGNTTEDGGGIYITGGSVDILNSLIDSNTTTACCGGIHVGNSAALTITNTQITWNISGEANAGGIGIFSGSVVTITNSDVSYNTTSGSSGGIRVDGAQVTVSNTTFTFNDADGGDGGAFGAYYGSSVRLTDIEAAYNHSGVADPPGHGSGLYFRDGAQGVVTRAEIHNNDAVECGGGIRIDDADTNVKVSDSQIYDNQAFCGGGISVNNGSMTLSDSEVENNSATKSGSDGGGVHLTDGGRIDITDGEISNNTTTEHGGAISAGNATMNITNTLITNNVATSGTANVLASGDSNVNFLNTTVVDNNPTGAQAVILWGGTMTMTNSIVWNSSLSLQRDCTVCSFVVNYSDIQGLSGIPDISSGVGNFDDDPLFANQELGDYHLKPNSPCIDKGTLLGAPEYDIEGNPRTPPPDVGAYEWIGVKIFLPMVVKQ